MEVYNMPAVHKIQRNDLEVSIGDTRVVMAPSTLPNVPSLIGTPCWECSEPIVVGQAYYFGSLWRKGAGVSSSSVLVHAKHLEEELDKTVRNLESEIPSLTAHDVNEAAGLHSEAMMSGDDWEFLGVFKSIRQGVIEAIQRGGQQFQCNYIPFEMEGLQAGYYIYFSKEMP